MNTGQYNVFVWMKLRAMYFCPHGGFCPFQRFAYRGFNSQSRENAGTEVTLPLGQARLAPAAGIPACKRSDEASTPAVTSAIPGRAFGSG